MKTIVSLVAVVLVGLSSAARAQNEQRLRDAFLSEAPQRWRELPDDLGCHRIESQKVERRNESGSKETVQRYRYTNLKSNGRELGSVEADQGQGLYTKTVCINDRYAFLVTQSQAGKSWLLDRIDLHPTQGPEAEIGGYKLRGPKRNIYWWLTINNNLELTDLVANPTFKITSASEQPISGQASEVRIEFTATNLVKKVIEEKYTGWMQFDRSRHWALTGYEMTITSTRDAGGHAVYKCTHKFIDHPKGLPISLKMVQEHKGYLTADKLFVSTTTEMDTRYSADCPKESEFELPAFGIAEPVGVAPKRNTLIWWFIGVGVIVALLGVYLLKRTGRI